MFGRCPVRDGTPALSRRRVLHGAVALLTGLAGCNDSTTDSGSAPADRRTENVPRDPEFVTLGDSDAGLSFVLLIE
ncbi:hypothetical protein [Halorussus sp. MSC15.2]|uniref:hypothetical protein n=1 Tax=Halorussus sp. MSC15.2 TaxID=2283638 RepID=UPI0013D5C3EC|nr:hypothetical protein [Halorussus sp. MSC15.2]NEU58328.1 hypothetical protein [Halorussus sp. MSC15.2]